jgi:hypothetical protein
MKTFNRTFLPKTINYNKAIYTKGEKTNNSIKVLVLSRRLKGKLNLHGKPYQPTAHYYNKEV